MIIKKREGGFTRQNFPQKVSGGFTLIELLVVIGIIAILATIVIASLNNSSSEAQDKKILDQLSSMRSQASLYSGPLGTPVVPTTAPVSGATIDLFNDTTQSDNSLYDLIASLPSGTPYYYGWDGNAPGVSGKWFFAAALENGGTACVDWTGNSKAGTTSVSSPSLVASWSAIVDAPSYSCL